MKKIVIIIIGAFIVLSMMDQKQTNIIIPKEAIRFRVIAASDSKEDQSTKLFVRDKIQKQLYQDLKDTKTIDEAEDKIKSQMNNYDNIIKNSLAEHAIDQKYVMNYGQNYFPEKIYKGVTYPEGNYESLVVTLGNGQGKNWWCVLFPPLCLLEAEETKEKDEVEYKFFIKELLDKYL